MKNATKRFLTVLAAVSLCCLLGTALAEDNVYVGENENGIGGVIRVEVTMDGDTIQSIKTVEQHETRGLGTTAILRLTEDIIAANSTEVDNVSGATLSSIAFRSAVQRAVEDALDVDPTAGVELGENEHLGVSEAGLGGRIMVKVTVVDGAITAIDVLESHESPEIGDVAIEKLIAKMIEGNTASVDTVGGATITSRALCEAVSQAMDTTQN